MQKIEKKDIHNRKREFENALASLENDDAIIKRNKELILEFIRDCRLGKTLKKRQKKVIGVARCTKWFKMGSDQAILLIFKGNRSKNNCFQALKHHFQCQNYPCKEQLVPEFIGALVRPHLTRISCLSRPKFNSIHCLRVSQASGMECSRNCNS